MAQDNFGRQLGDVDIQQMQQIMSQMLKSLDAHKKGKPSKDTKEMLDLLKKISGDIEESLEETKKYYKEVKKFQDEEKKTDKKQLKNDEGVQKALKDVVMGMRGRGGSGIGRGGGGGVGGVGGGDYGNRALSIASGQITGMLGGTGMLQHIWKGTVEHELEFMQNMRAIAFQTQGITGDTESLQKAWQETGNVVSQTGKNLTMFQRTLVTQLKKGVVSREEELKLTKTSLNLSTMIGSEAGSTADTFHDMHVSLGLSNNQMAEFSRGAQEVAKSTGVTGDNLMKAVQSAQTLVTAMRNAATMSAQASKNILAIQAGAQKMGIGEQSDRLMRSMASSAELYLKAGSQTQALLFQAAGTVGRINELTTGTIISSKAGMADMAKGLEKIFQNFGTTMEGIDNLSPQRLMQINLALEATYGIQAGELKRVVENIKEQSMTYGQIVDKLTNEMKNANLTTEERINLEKRLSDVHMGAGFSFLTAVDEAGKKAQSLPDAIEKATEKLGPELIKELGLTGMGPLQKFQKMALLTANTLKEAGGKDFTSAIQNAISGGDVGKVRELLADMNTEQQKLGVASAKNLDPITAIQHTTDKINESIRGFTKPLIAGVLGILGQTGLMTLYLGSMAAQMGVFGKISGSIKKLFGGKGAEGVSTVSKVGHGFGGKAAGKAIGGGVGGGGGGGGIESAITGPTDMMGKVGEAVKTGIKNLEALNFADAKKLIGLLIKGAVVLVLLSAALIAIAAAIVLIAKGILYLTGMDPNEAAETAWAVAKLLLSIALIAGAVLAASAGLWALGLLATWAWVAIPIMLLGAGALILLVPAIILLAGAIIGIAQAAMSAIVNPEEASKTVDNLASILWSAAKIAGIIIGMTGFLTVLGVMAMLTWLLVPLLKIGGAALIELTAGLVEFAGAIISLTRSFLQTIVNPEKAAETAKNLASILDAASSIAGSVINGVTKLAALGAMAVISFIFGGTLAAAAIGLFIMIPAVKMIASAVQAVIAVLKVAFPNSEGVTHNIKLAQTVLEAMTGVIVAIADTADVMSKKLVGLTDGWFFGVAGDSVADDIEESIPSLKSLVGSMADFTKAVIEILKAKFPNKEGVAHNIKVAAGVLTSMAEMMTAISTVSDVMSKKLVGLADGWFFGVAGDSVADDIRESIPSLQSLVGSMAEFTGGIIDVLKKEFPNKEGVAHNIKVAAVVLTAMATVMTKIGEVIDVLKEKLMPLTKGWVFGLFGASAADNILKSKDKFSDFFKKIAEFFKDGIVAPIDNIFADNGEKTVQSLMNLARLISVLPDFLTGVAQRMDSLMSGESKANIEKLARMKETFGDRFRGVAEFIKQGILDPIDTLPAAGEINKSLQKVNVLSNVLGKLVGVMEHLGKIMSIMSKTKFEPTKAVEGINNLITSLGGLGIGGSNLGEAKTGTAITGPISDAHDRIRAKHALEKEQGGGGGDMAQISASTLDQVSLLGILHEDNMKIIDLLTPSDLMGSEMDMASTMTQNNNPATPSQYGGWQTGTSSKNTTRGVT